MAEGLPSIFVTLGSTLTSNSNEKDMTKIYHTAACSDLNFKAATLSAKC